MKWYVYTGVGVVLIVLLGYVALVIWARRAPKPANLGVTPDGQLADLPQSPNAVSTQTDDEPRRIDPLPYRGSRDETRGALLELLRSLPRVTIVTDEPGLHGYIHAEFRTKLVGYIDDVEFIFDDAAKVVHFRSASRLGHSDLGANRARMLGVQTVWNPR